MFLTISKTAKTVLAVRTKTLLAVLAVLVGFVYKSLILKEKQADKKTDRTAKNISKNGRHGQNPLGFCPLAVNVDFLTI